MELTQKSSCLGGGKSEYLLTAVPWRVDNEAREAPTAGAITRNCALKWSLMDTAMERTRQQVERGRPARLEVLQW